MNSNTLGIAHNCLVAAFILATIVALPAQTDITAGEKSFKIFIQTTPEAIHLQCEEGCAWKELNFSTHNDEPQTIDEYGMTDFNSADVAKDMTLTDFLFVLTKTKDGISLQGLEGVAWKALSFSLSDGQRKSIDSLVCKIEVTLEKIRRFL